MERSLGDDNGRGVLFHGAPQQRQARYVRHHLEGERVALLVLVKLLKHCISIAVTNALPIVDGFFQENDIGIVCIYRLQIREQCRLS